MIQFTNVSKKYDNGTHALKDIVNITFNSFEKHDDELAYKVEPLEQVVDLLGSELKSRHIKRLQDGRCTIELGFVLSDIITNFTSSQHNLSKSHCVQPLGPILTTLSQGSRDNKASL